MSKNNISEGFEDQTAEELTEQKEGTETKEISEIEVLKENLQSEKEKYLRLFAEFDNYKKRTAKERLDIFKTANSETIVALLPVLDDFERALKEIEKSEDSGLLEGVLLIQNKMTDILRGKGLKSIEINEGDDFDTDTMDAAARIPAPSKDLKGKVIDVIQTGYTLNDKVVRYAKVVTGE